MGQIERIVPQINNSARLLWQFLAYIRIQHLYLRDLRYCGTAFHVKGAAVREQKESRIVFAVAGLVGVLSQGGRMGIARQGIR